jgi:hypothetical protein
MDLYFVIKECVLPFPLLSVASPESPLSATLLKHRPPRPSWLLELAPSLASRALCHQFVYVFLSTEIDTDGAVRVAGRKRGGRSIWALASGTAT